MKYISILILVFCFLLGMDLLFVLLYHAVGGEMFDLDWEGNLPTLYQSAKLGLGAVLALYVAWLCKPQRKEVLAWMGFVGGLGYLALDEWLQIHETISRITDEILLATVGRVSFSAWIIAYTPVMIVAAYVLYLIYKYVIRAPQYTSHRVHYWFVAAMAALFAVPVVEVWGSLVWNFEGPANIWIISLEEGLEMVGISLVIGMLIAAMQAKRSSQGVSISQP